MEEPKIGANLPVGIVLQLVPAGGGLEEFGRFGPLLRIDGGEFVVDDPRDDKTLLVGGLVETQLDAFTLEELIDRLRKLGVVVAKAPVSI